MKRKSLSVVLATFNEEKNLPACLESVKGLADEIVIVDGTSKDKTAEIAKKYGAKVIVTDNPPIFHINKQKALEAATKDWILQLDADERVSSELAKEIEKVLSMTSDEIGKYEEQLPDKALFDRHLELLKKRDGKIGKEGDYTGFFVPRLNYFLGKYLRYGGVYPDGVIRLVKKGKAHFPCKDVHEQIVVDGKVGWLQNPLYHYDSPTFFRYLKRNNRYTNLMAAEFGEKKMGKHIVNDFKYLIVLPVWWFLWTFIRHKGFLDGWRGFLFSFFSAMRFPISYTKYLSK